MNITIGQYYPVNSIIHSIDSRIKIICLFIYIVALFLGNDFLQYISCCAFLFFIIALSKVPVKLLFNGLKPLWFIIIFTSFFNICFSSGDNVIFHFAFINITFDGIILSAKIIIRLIILISASALLTLTTTPLELTNAVESLLKPLKKVKFPVHEIAMMMSIAIRFIPTLMDEADKIKKAQIARGADFNARGITAKAKSLLPLLVPLFVSAFRRADELALAMEARCYRGDINRTKMKIYKLKKIDFLAVLITFIFFFLSFMLKYFY